MTDLSFYACVVSNGAVKMSAGSRPARDRIRKNYSYLEDELRSEEYAGVLFEKDCISQRDKDDLEDGRKSRREKAHLLTDILLRKSEQVIETFFEILRSERRKQPHIYYRLFPEHAHEHEQLSRHSHTQQQQQSDNSSTYKETTEQMNVFDQSGSCKRDVSDVITAGTLQGGRSEINVQASSSGAAGLLALRVPSTASLEVLTTAMEIARDVAVEGIARGHSSTVAGSEGGAAGGFAAVEVYVPKSEADSDLKGLIHKVVSHLVVRIDELEFEMALELPWFSKPSNMLTSCMLSLFSFCMIKYIMSSTFSYKLQWYLVIALYILTLVLGQGN